MSYPTDEPSLGLRDSQHKHNKTTAQWLWAIPSRASLALLSDVAWDSPDNPLQAN